MTPPITSTGSEWIPLTDTESKAAVDAFYKAMPGVYGVPEAIDEMLNALCEAGIIFRTRASAKPSSAPAAAALSKAILEAHEKWKYEYQGVGHE